MSGQIAIAELRPGRSDRNLAVAWFVPGADIKCWLPIILTATSETKALRFRVIGDKSGSAIGAVVTGCPPLEHPLCLPYVKRAERLFLPLAASIYPAISEDELTQKLASSAVAEFVWHPGAGLIGYESEQILPLSSFLKAAKTKDSDWSQATAGLFFNRQLKSVRPFEDLDPDRVFEDGRDDIGTESDNLGNVPPAPGEVPHAGWTGLAARALSPLAKAAHWLTQQVPGNATSRTWVNSLQDWAGRILERAAISQSRRLQELNRLLSMLNQDPDRGLKYALPFGGDQASRGPASVSNQLGWHNVDYQGWSGRGGASDVWGVPPDVAAALITRYQELAQREIRLGRYRRAAYIYASLLGDYAAAAQTLADGGFYREAAEVFRQRLRQPRKAAECLLCGGLWEEAIEIFEELKDWQTVAETHVKLGNSEAAVEAWRTASAECEQQGNYIKAASIHEKQLEDVASAELLLRQGWTNSSMTKDCLAELFGLHARKENHGAAAGLVTEVADDPRMAVTRQEQASQILASISQSYPDAGIRSVASDKARRVVARNLDVVDRRNRSRFLSVLQSLAPEDKLLGRDCRRFNQAAAPSVRRPYQLTCLTQLSLSGSVKWQRVVKSGRRIFVAGYEEDSLVLAGWEDGQTSSIEYVRWYVRQERQGPILLTAAMQQAGCIFLHVVGNGLSEKDFSCKSSTLGARVRNLPGSDASVVAAGSSGHGTVWTMNQFQSVMEIHGFKESGSPIINRGLPVQVLSYAPRTFIQPFQRGLIACVVDDKFISVLPGTVTASLEDVTSDRFAESSGSVLSDGTPEKTPNIEEIDLPAAARYLCARKHGSEPRVAVLFADGGLIHWMKSSDQQRFGDGLIDPVATFLANEDFIATDTNGRIEIYRTHQQQLQHVHACDGNSGRPIGIVPTRAFGAGIANEFLIVREDGVIDVYDYPT